MEKELMNCARENSKHAAFGRRIINFLVFQNIFQVSLKSLLTISIISLFSCGQKNSSKNVPSIINNPKNGFTIFLNKFKNVELPLEITGCKLDKTVSKNLIALDTATDKQFIPEIGLAYGRIKTNGNYIAVIYLAPADCFIPILATFNLNGTKIDSKPINIGGCGFDCGFECKEIMVLNKNYQIFTSDTIASSDCDSLGNIDQKTTKHFVVFKTGLLDSNGIIHLSKETSMNLK
jgi:hypothetical protein